MNSRSKQILYYILPSAGGLCVTYLYNIVDGIFVGQGVGALALAAVNITVPFITALVAISILFAMGGSTVIAIRLGRGDKKGANDAFMTALVLTLLLSILLLIIGMTFSEQIARLCGSSERVLPLAKEYLFFYTAFAIPFLLSNCLAIFVRNDGAPGLAFGGMCAGAVANIFLDWLFIFPMKMGIMGAAVASGLGQVLSFVILISHFIRKKGDLRIGKFTHSFALVKKICNRGVPECFSQLNTPVTAFCYNWVLVGTLGDMGVATFSVLSFIYSLANGVLSGVAQELKTDFQTGMKINLAASVVIYGILAVFRVPVVRLFNSEPELVEMASGALPIFAVSFVFMAVNLIFTAYYYSTKQTWKSNIIAVSRGILVKAAAIFLVPALLGETWVWASAAVAEGITLIIIFIIGTHEYCSRK